MSTPLFGAIPFVRPIFCHIHNRLSQGALSTRHKLKPAFAQHF
jgi:hypothetical protein